MEEDSTWLKNITSNVSTKTQQLARIYIIAKNLILSLMNTGVANSIIGGGAHIHIFEFTDHENNRFQKKLIAQNMNI